MNWQEVIIKSILTFGIPAGLSWLRQRFRTQQSGILILGPAGVGKSTFGRILSGKFDPPGTYDESLEVEKYTLTGARGVQVLVPPGQEIRREAFWSELLDGLSAGNFGGMILVQAYGYHNHELGTGTSYCDHPLYQGDLSKFRQAFLEDRREEELRILREILPKVTPPATGKFWLLTLVTKQDLWWDDIALAKNFYTTGDYKAEVDKVEARHGNRNFRHEVALASLEISNFKTGQGRHPVENTRRATTNNNTSTRCRNSSQSLMRCDAGRLGNEHCE